MVLKKNCLMELYTEHDDSFSVGFLLSSFDNYNLFHLIDAQGKSDGIYLIKSDFIKYIDYNTAYTQKINLYIEFWKKNFMIKDIFSIEFWKNDFTIEDILNHIKKNKILSSFKLANKDYLITGYINFIDKTNIRITTIDIETAKETGDVTFAGTDILLLEIESIDNRLLNYAHQNISIFENIL